MNNDKTESPSGAPGAIKNTGKPIKKILVGSGVTLLLLGLTVGVYLWQHNKVNAKSAEVSALNVQAADLKKKNASLSKQVSQLNRNLQAATKSATKTPTPSQAAPTSLLVVTGVKQIAASKYNSSAKDTDTYQEVDFTIYNNSAATQTYNLVMLDSYVKGVTSTGSIVTPYALISGSSGDAWNHSTVLPGGSTDGFALFDLNTPLSITKLSWLPPGNNQPIFVALPN